MMKTQRRGTGSQWRRRLVAVLLAVLAAVMLNAAPAHAGECKPTDIPDRAGSGLSGMINPQVPVPNPQTKYGQYGWSGLQWHTCDLGDGGWGSDWVPDPAKDPDAFLDTFSGNLGLGLATILAASITQLHVWVSDPGSIMKPIDDMVEHVTTAIRDSVWATWVSPLIILAACFAAAWAWKADIRRAARTVVAIMLACAAVYALGQQWTVEVKTKVATGETVSVTATKAGSVALASMFDGVANGIVTQVDQKIAEASGDKSDQKSVQADEARGATLDDQLLWKIWERGATGSMDDGSRAGKSAGTLYAAQTVKWTELDKVDVDKRTDDYKNEADALSKDDGSAYQVLTGKARGREGLGWLAAAFIIVVAVIRIPAELMVLLGLLTVRIVVMMLPLFALAAIVESTRPIAISAGKMVFAAVYNTAVMGVIASVHTAITAAIVANSQDNLIRGFVLLLGLTVVLWLATKPFRSVTRPATGTAVAQAMEGTAEAPGNAFSSLKAMAGSAVGSYFGSKVGSSEGVREAEDAHPDTYTASEAQSNTPPESEPLALTRGYEEAGELPPPRITVTAEPSPSPSPSSEPAPVPVVELPPAAPGGGDRIELEAAPRRAVDDEPSTEVEVYSGDGRRDESVGSGDGAVPDPDVFDPRRGNYAVTVEGQVLDVTEEIAVNRHVRYVEPEVNERGDVTYDLWTPDAAPAVVDPEADHAA